jgi:hypothetical protein
MRLFVQSVLATNICAAQGIGLKSLKQSAQMKNRHPDIACFPRG